MFNSLRKYKPDELPELWNVLNGEKSFNTLFTLILKISTFMFKSAVFKNKLDIFSISKIS